MHRHLPFLLILLSLVLISPSPAKAAVLTVDTVWKDEVTLSEDVLVPAGVTLTLRPGTIVRVVAAESTKTDPEFISPLTEISVRGRLKIEGTHKDPVKLLSQDGKSGGEWAGVLLDGGEADISNCIISGAESAIYAHDAALLLDNSTLSGN
ncbi:MAG TPA: right-handed parallel beta-helix repeat-containing protein, partial [Geobacteraceae bacterium]|nr:right-handed parallel beta-helix repeat-containing protein [Geobacteraceae bacterium]